MTKVMGRYFLIAGEAGVYGCMEKELMPVSGCFSVHARSFGDMFCEDSFILKIP